MNEPTGTEARVFCPIQTGDRVICTDDAGWLIPDPGFEHLSPEKGRAYTVREYQLMGGVGAISLMEGSADNFYRACRFRKIQN